MMVYKDLLQSFLYIQNNPITDKPDFISVVHIDEI